VNTGVPMRNDLPSPAAAGLPREVDSICPECGHVIPALLVEEDGRVVMRKSCPEHGPFTDLIASHADIYLRAERYAFDDSVRLENPLIADPRRCPEGCGLCPGHLSSASMTNLDLTNRCNLRCPFCFANANVLDYVYEPDPGQIREMMDRALAMRPKRLQAIQFSGGEPTLSPHFLEACSLARDRGVRLVQAATNGIRFAREPEFARAAAGAGLNGAYLQFDGIGDEIHRKTRGVKGLWSLKLKALEACRENGIRVTLVPTLIRGLNDHMVGDILRFAVDHMDCIVGISFQPVAFTGRIDQEQRLSQRYTLTDLITGIEDQTGMIGREDWYPFTITAPFAEVIDNVLGPDAHGFYAMHCNSHPGCGQAAYLLVNERTGQTVPLSQLIDVDETLRQVTDLARKTRNKPSRLYTTARILAALMKVYNPEKAPEGLSLISLAKTIDAISGKRMMGIAKKRRYEWRLLLVSSMHFQDAYNFQVDRVRRCTIHYSTPSGRIYPFCTYNCGATFRTEVEKAHSVPREEWIRTRGAAYVTEGFEE